MSTADELHLLQLVQGGTLIRALAVCTPCRDRMLDPASDAASLAATLRPGSVWKPVEDLALASALHQHLSRAKQVMCCVHFKPDVADAARRLGNELTNVAILVTAGGLA